MSTTGWTIRSPTELTPSIGGYLLRFCTLTGSDEAAAPGSKPHGLCLSQVRLKADPTRRRRTSPDEGGPTRMVADPTRMVASGFSRSGFSRTRLDGNDRTSLESLPK